MTRPQLEDLILAARVKAGWIDEADLVEEPAEGEDEAEGEATAEAGAEATAETDKPAHETPAPDAPEAS